MRLKKERFFEKLLDLAITKGLKTGSALFYSPIFAKDIDFVLKRSDIKFDIDVEESFERYNLSFLSLKFFHEDLNKYVNVIVVSDEDFVVWEKSTNDFLRVIHSSKSVYNMMKDKEIRCQFFENLKTYHKKRYEKCVE